MINIYQQPKDFHISDNVWWIVYEDDSKEILSDIQEPQYRGFISSSSTLVTADTKEELEQFITDNQLYFPPIPEPVVPPFP
jgi:hypothetical protein